MGDDVDVVCYTTDLIDPATLLLKDTGDVGEEVRAYSLVEGWLAVLRAEDDLVEDLCVGTH